jgi:hypothetical protein
MFETSTPKCILRFRFTRYLGSRLHFDKRRNFNPDFESTRDFKNLRTKESVIRKNKLIVNLNHTPTYLSTGEGSMESSSSKNLLRRPPTQATPVATVQVVVVVVVAVVVEVRK